MANLVYQEASNLISSVANQAIISPLGDPYTIGISGLIFDIIGDVGVEIDSDITDHFVEANYTIQDHWAQKPIRVTMQGYAAELVSVFQPNIIQEIFSALSGLVLLPGLAPTFNVQDSQFYAQMNAIAQLEQNIVNTTLNAFQIFNNASTLVTRQQTVFQFLLNMWQQRILATVETPYAVFENMAIESIRPTQSGDTTKVSEFIVRFKQIQTVNSIQATPNASSTNTQNTGTTSSQNPIAGGVAQSYSAPTVNLGNTTGNAGPSSNTIPILPSPPSALPLAAPSSDVLPPVPNLTPSVPQFSVPNTIQPTFLGQATMPLTP